MYDTLQSTKHIPLQCQLVKFCTCAEFLGIKLLENFNLRLLKVSRLKREFQARYVIMVNYIPRFFGKKKTYNEFWY